MFARTIFSRNRPKIVSLSNDARFKLSNSAPINEDCDHKPRRIFSGIQPTGSVHLGNYVGAILPWKKLQDSGEDVILEIADLHSITLPQDPKNLSQSILEMTASILACGINAEKVILFQQSSVFTHAELSWILGCTCTIARLSHLPAFKEKSSTLKDVPVGLFLYPVLQAADILAYKATHVPVGEDQWQHIQLTQDLAKMFNKRYGKCFPIPHTMITDNVYSRLKSLRDPNKKMSKSDPDPRSRISLLDKPDEIQKKFKKAVTDFTSEVYFDPERRPGVSNLISIHSIVSNKDIMEICRESKGLNTAQYKSLVADAVIEYLKPIQTDYHRLLSEEAYILEILQNGADRAKEISCRTMQEVKDKIGFSYSSKNTSFVTSRI
ncbi:tryptophan--tRNA ligase, mitochondrial [Coccinella septempunctata]|uniref:tryptophan--tRNA ligase, mitochondrial n=1 Tax=Coccinella septempunctata TaxID=41139 RepID=UPI001D0885EA|nr:tryptophan--tRNA ligase, mitochondrial [Coccinella septempunctata]